MVYGAGEDRLMYFVELYVCQQASQGVSGFVVAKKPVLRTPHNRLFPESEPVIFGVGAIAGEIPGVEKAARKE
jgi:hypothetical protein